MENPTKISIRSKCMLLFSIVYVFDQLFSVTSLGLTFNGKYCNGFFPPFVVHPTDRDRVAEMVQKFNSCLY